MLSKPKIAFAARNFGAPAGGMEQFSRDVLEALRPAYDVRPVVHQSGKLGQFPYMLGLRSRLKRLRAREGVQAVDASDASLSPFVTRAGLRTSIRVHGLDLLYANPAYQALVRRALPRVDLVVANSRPTRALLSRFGLPEERSTVIHPAAAAPTGWRHRAVHREILMLGRLVPRKGVAEFVRDVWPGLAKDHTEARLHIVGDGPERSHLGIQLRAAPHADRVTFHGRVPRPEVEKRLATAEVVVMNNRHVPGNFEGFGMVAIEAAVRGVPVVAGRVDGVVDAVVPGRSGLLCEPEDPGALRAALEDVFGGKLPSSSHIADFARRTWGMDRLREQYVDALKPLVA